MTDQNEAYIGLRSGKILHHDFRTSSAPQPVSELKERGDPVINLIGLENSFGCGRGLIVGRMGSEVGLHYMSAGMAD